MSNELVIPVSCGILAILVAGHYFRPGQPTDPAPPAVTSIVRQHETGEAQSDDVAVRRDKREAEAIPAPIVQEAPSRELSRKEGGSLFAPPADDREP